MTNLQPFRVSNDALGDPAELRRRIADEGYLFLRKLQDPDKLWQLRLDVLKVIKAGGWIKPGTALADGRVDPARACTEGERAYADVYRNVQKLRSMHAAGHWPGVVDLIGELVEGPVLPHPMKIVRLWFPQYTEHTTPFHQDFVHFQSNLDVLTVWTPLGDCPLELGPLAVVEGSHKVGRVLEHHFSLGAGGQKVTKPEERGIPRCSDFEIGDTLIFGCLMVHGALPNETPDQVRASLDNRYQSRGLPVSEHQLNPHLVEDLAWEELYADWPDPDDELKYYWKPFAFDVIPKDTGFGERAWAQALELAGHGDEAAILALQRAVANETGTAPATEPATEPATAARRVLAEAGIPVAAPAR